MEPIFLSTVNSKLVFDSPQLNSKCPQEDIVKSKHSTLEWTLIGQCFSCNNRVPSTRVGVEARAGARLSRSSVRTDTYQGSPVANRSHRQSFPAFPPRTASRNSVTPDKHKSSARSTR